MKATRESKAAKGNPSERLLRWYKRYGRDLPWRKRRDPYAIWVAEAMLQQTTVNAVIPYYERWLFALPDIDSLAEAGPDKVMKLWEGLGYYSRALSLHKAAGIIVRERRGVFPVGESEWRTLPGVGSYTAAALAAIVDGRRHVAIDGLVRRVLFRFLGMEGDATKAQAVERMRDEGLVLISKKHPGDSVQAIMDLATAVCMKTNPKCSECPIARSCAAYVAGDPGRLPLRKRKSLKSIDVVVGIWLRDGAVYLQRRPNHGLFAGLWELPGGKVEIGESPAEAIIREFREELGRSVHPVETLQTVQHAYTSFNVKLHPFIVRGTGPKPKAVSEGLFVSLPKIGQYAQPAANKKIWRLFFERGST
jgi:A/G-specific adenine glycosylase